MAVYGDSGFDWLGALGRGLSVGSGLYDIYGTGRNTSTGINQAAAAAANPFGSQFAQYQAPLAQTTLTPKSNEFGAARSNLFGGYSNALSNPLSNQFGAGRSSLYGQYQDLLADPNKFTSDPFYQWQQQQGLGNLERSLAGRGLLDSGNALTEITKFGQGLAGQSYGNRLAQLQGGIGTASGLYGQDVSQLGAGAELASDIYGQDWNNLYRLSGAQQGSPSQAGQILAGRYEQMRNALGDIGYGLRGGSGSGSNPLNQLINQGISKGVQGVSDWFRGLGGGATGGSTALVDALLSGQVTAEQLPWITAGLEGGGDLGMLTTAQALQNPSWGGLDFLGGAGGEAAGSFGAGSEAAAAGLGGAATFGAGDTAANLAAFYGGYAPAAAEGAAAGTGAAAGFGGGGAGEAAAGAGLGSTALMAGAVAWPLLWDTLLSATGRNTSKEDAQQDAMKIQSQINTMGREAFADLYMNPEKQVDTRLAAQMQTWGRGGQDSQGRPLTAESAKEMLKNTVSIYGNYSGPVIDQAYGSGAAKRYADEVSAQVDKVWKEQNLDQVFKQRQSEGIQYPRVGY